MFVIARETFVLCLGTVIAAIAPPIFRFFGNRLELLPGIVIPIVFCLGRLIFVPACPQGIGTLRQIAYSLLRAFALIMLFLFELGVGLFAGANDIPGFVWAIIGCFGVAYVMSIFVIEKMRPPEANAAVTPNGILG